MSAFRLAGIAAACGTRARRSCRVAALALIALSGGCAKKAPPAPAPAPAPAAPFDTMTSYRVPAFRSDPPVTWGPSPPGVHRAVRAREYDLQHQTVRVAFDWERHAVVGTTTLRVAALDTALSIVSLDAVGMTIAGVRGADGARLEHFHDGRTLMIRLPRPLRPKARTTVTVQYESPRPRRGLYFVDRRHVAWTHGKVEGVRHWIPTFDHPSDKATWELHVRTERGERALSNGRALGMRRLPCRRGTTCEDEWYWAQQKPAPTRSMAVVTGKYDALKGSPPKGVRRRVPVHYWTYPDSTEAAQRAFAATPVMLDLFARTLGVPYPWPKYDQVVVPDYGYEPMENASATTFSDDDVLTPAWAEPHVNAEWAIARALARQWFGALVSARDYSHIWLDEAFATFIAQLWIEAKDAEAGDLARLRAHDAVVAAERAARRPTVFGAWQSDPSELYTPQADAKGALVLHMLRRAVGDSLFWLGVRRYLENNKYGSVVTADLERAFSEATGRDLSQFFRQWVHGAGFPVTRVSFRYDILTRRLSLATEQVQARDSLTGLFDADVEVEALTDRGPVRGEMAVREGKGALTLTLPAAPRAIRWNKGSWLLDVADFPRPTTMLVYQLEHDRDLLGRIEALRLLGERRREPMAAHATLRALAGDSAWSVRAEAAAAVAALSADTVARNALIDASADPNPGVRVSVVRALRGYNHVFVTTRLRVMLLTDPSWFVRAEALRTYAALTPVHAAQEIRDFLGRATWRDIARTAALTALGEVDAPSAWEVLPRYLDGLSSRSARLAAIGSLVAHRQGRESQLAALLEPLVADDDLFVRRAAADALGAVRFPASLAALEAQRRVEADSRVIAALDSAVAAIKKR